MKTLFKNLNEHNEQNRYRTTRVTVFLTKEQYKKFIDIKYQYRLSISLIAEIIYLNYIYTKDLNKVLLNERFYKTENEYRKTTIKFNKQQQEQEEYNKAKYINNALIMFIEKQESNYIDQNKAQQVRNKIFNCFQNSLDPFFNYNENYRQFYYMKEHTK